MFETLNINLLHFLAIKVTKTSFGFRKRLECGNLEGEQREMIEPLVACFGKHVWKCMNSLRRSCNEAMLVEEKDKQEVKEKKEEKREEKKDDKKEEKREEKKEEMKEEQLDIVLNMWLQRSDPAEIVDHNEIIWVFLSQTVQILNQNCTSSTKEVILKNIALRCSC
jgi:hypothetical protein